MGVTYSLFAKEAFCFGSPRKLGTVRINIQLGGKSVIVTGRRMALAARFLWRLDASDELIDSSLERCGHSSPLDKCVANGPYGIGKVGDIVDVSLLEMAAR
jgi:hypothetical protein